MERTERVPQMYGYTVCLITLVWAVVSAVAIVENSLSMSAPELRAHSDFQFRGEPAVSSFEAFRTTYDRSRQVGGPAEVKLDSVPEAELRRRYESLRADRIASGRFETRRNLIMAAFSLVIAVSLFAFHWRWLRRRPGTAVS